MAEHKLKRQNCLEVLHAWRPFRPRDLLGLGAFWAWRPFGPGGPSGQEALWARRSFGPRGPLGLKALQAWGPFGPGGPLGLSLPPTISSTILSGGSESCFNPFSYFSILLRMTLFFFSYWPNQPPYTIFFSPKCVEMSKLP